MKPSIFDCNLDTLASEILSLKPGQELICGFNPDDCVLFKQIGSAIVCDEVYWDTSNITKIEVTLEAVSDLLKQLRSQT